MDYKMSFTINILVIIVLSLGALLLGKYTYIQYKPILTNGLSLWARYSREKQVRLIIYGVLLFALLVLEGFMIYEAYSYLTYGGSGRLRP